jgi:predicted polyphosphate/ATP-dependent NAD kinase
MGNLSGDSGRPTRIGFLVNPIAGMGGSVGLKGTDGSRYREAIGLGAVPVAPGRAMRFLGALDRDQLRIITIDGLMGQDLCLAAGLECRSVDISSGGPDAHPTSRDDTVSAAERLVSLAVELIVFVGGDGTARDVHEGVADRIPILGVPSGVKMFSAVFAPTPEAAARAVATYFASPGTTEAEILDVDEDAYAAGRLTTRLYGVAVVPASPHVVTVGKQIHPGADEERLKDAIAVFVAESIGDGTAILGPGSTVARIEEHLLDSSGPEAIGPSLLGFDVVKGGRAIVLDGGASELEPHVDAGTVIVLSPIGAQGYFLGRGTQQLTPELLHRVDPENIMVVATPTKLHGLRTLRVDTGDPELDEMLRGYRPVVTGYRELRMVAVA